MPPIVKSATVYTASGSDRPGTRTALVLPGPGQAVGLPAGVDVGGDLKGFEVDGDDVVVRGAGDESASTVGLDEDSCGAAADRNAFCFAASSGVKDDDIRTDE